MYENIKAGRYAFGKENWKYVSEASQDFIRKLLQLDPQQRMSAREALVHEWMQVGAASLCLCRTVSLKRGLCAAPLAARHQR